MRHAEDMKVVAVALRDFALPVPRTGSIEAHSGYGRAAADGQEIHARIQRKRTTSDPSYEPEVSIKRVFDRDGYRFEVDGRMDGIFRRDPPTIEEIKTGFAIRDLAARLSDRLMDHPYGLQLQTYGYFYWLEHRVVPRLRFHLVSSRNGESIDLEQTLDLPAYEQWLESRLDELVREVKKNEKGAARRRKIAAGLSFPFAKPRSGQSELMQSIEEGMRAGNRMLIQAPTGLGKTVGVLYPLLKEAFGRGQSVVYVTPKNSQHAVAEDAVTRFRGTGANLKSLTITAKRKICFKNEPLCDPDYCEYAREYYTKVHENGILDILAKRKQVSARTFLKLGDAYQVCPYELQFDGMREADLVICDYHYVFAPRSAFRRTAMAGIDQVGKPNLLIDEVHNLPARAMEYYSPSLSSAVLEDMLNDLRIVPPPVRSAAEELLDGCIRTILACQPDDRPGPARIDPPVRLFQEQDARLRVFLSRYLDSGADIRHRDAILRLCCSWSEFTEILEYAGDPGRTEFFTTFHPHPAGGTVKVTCCDASVMLESRYDDFAQIVGCSATLKPFDYYATLSGLNPGKVRTAEFPSPFLKERRKLLIIPQVSTRYSDRERNYSRIADAIGRITAVRRGNYLAFFPSFEFLERVFGSFRPPDEFEVLRQERKMKRPQVEAILNHLRSQTVPTIVFAVQGGVFSEGLDYPGEMAIGAFVVGPPLPNYDLEREEMRAYYQRRYGAGFDFAYAIPAMAKAIQSAGRVIRSETDRGLIVLMDNRFVQSRYACSMPADWFETRATELVSTSILKEVSDFWECSRTCEGDGVIR
jgi:DNA excision repair protein ERCC-2